MWIVPPSNDACFLSQLFVCSQQHPLGVLFLCRHLSALPGLHLIRSSPKFRHKTVQYQLRQLLRLCKTQQSETSFLKVVVWHDVIDTSSTPHSSNFNLPLSPTALVSQLKALCGDTASVVHSQRTGSTKVFNLLKHSSLVLHPVVHHLLSHC